MKYMRVSDRLFNRKFDLMLSHIQSGRRDVIFITNPRRETICLIRYKSHKDFFDQKKRFIRNKLNKKLRFKR